MCQFSLIVPQTIRLTGQCEGQNICGIFSETAFVSYGVKQKLKSRYANERWAYLDQIPAPFRAGDVSEVTCRIRAMSKSYLCRHYYALASI